MPPMFPPTMPQWGGGKLQMPLMLGKGKSKTPALLPAQPGGVPADRLDTGASWGDIRASGGTDRDAAATRLRDAQHADQWGQQTNQQGYQDLQKFDPNAAFQTYAKSAWDQSSEGLSKQLDTLAERGAAAGRTSTGFFDKDQGQTVRDVMRDYGNTISGAALQTANMDLSRRGALLNYGAGQQGRSDALQEQNYQDIEDRRRYEKSKKSGGLGGALKGAAGAFIGSGGNPWATVAGGVAGGL